ncbi:MAG TPA: 2-isopropylmalate synthase [Herpetosiphonaceae bacterium]
MEDHVKIFDTTLRDGEQSPGATMTAAEKLEIAGQLARLGVDIIEAGFPAASTGDWEAVHTIARNVGTPDGPVIAGLARANRKDIERCWSAVKAAAKPRIHTFLATSDIHLEHKLRMSREQVLQTVREMVGYARSLCADVEFSPEDAGRSDPTFLHAVLAVAIEAGATTLNIPDTVGYLTPDEYGALIRGIREHVPGVDGVTISTHCHDDLGFAVANSLAGVNNGARQVECTINGIGERAGNAALEEIVMALHTRRQFYGVGTRIDTTQIARTSRMVSAITGLTVQPNKAIIGANAFSHESGIHQDGMLKNHLTYEIMRPETIGRDSTLVLGKLSGRHAFRKHLERLGYSLNDQELQLAFARFKDLADKKKFVDDRDIVALLDDQLHQPPPIWHLEHVQVACGTQAIPTATVRLRGPDGEIRTDSGQGTGPIDAVYRAINRVVGQANVLTEFSIQAITEGIDAVGNVTIRIEEATTHGNAHHHSGEPDRDEPDARRPTYSGHGVHTDIIVAAAHAYMGALNKLIAARQERMRARATSYAHTNTPAYAVDLFGNSTLGRDA